MVQLNVTLIQPQYKAGAFKGPAKGQCLNCMDEQEYDLTIPDRALSQLDGFSQYFISVWIKSQWCFSSASKVIKRVFVSKSSQFSFKVP